MFKKVDFFVYSGTGNTFRTAKIIGGIAAHKGIPYEINMIDSKAEPGGYTPENENLLGLMSSTLGFIQPLSFFKFICSLPKGNGMKVFIMITGAWTKLGGWFLPGFIGMGPYLAALILTIKGYKVVGIDGAGLPHNWTTFFPPYGKRLENRIFSELKEQVTGFTNTILDGRRVFKRKWDLFFGILLFPISFMFIVLGHLALAKAMFANHRCNGCGLCSIICPNKAIKMVGTGKMRPYWTLKCEQCMRCVGFCPNKAVEGSLAVLVFYMVIYKWAMDVVVAVFHTGNSAVLLAVGYIVFIFVIILGYILFFYLNKIKAFNKFFTYSAITFYWRKYKEPSVNLREFSKTIE